MKKLIIAIGLMISGSLYSQGYQYQSELENNTEAGFYKVALSPDVLGKLKPNYADLRLKDKAGQSVPYYLEKESFSVNKRVFKQYKIKEKIKWKNGATVLFVENTAQNAINNIQLQIKNFDVRKRLELAGSNDYNEWFTIKENYVFRSANGGNLTSEVKSLNFPYSDYKYYRIIIYDVFSLPINVMKVGYYDTYQELGKFTELVSPEAELLDTAGIKETYIKIVFNDKPYFDRLFFEVEKPVYFYRNVRLALKEVDYKGRTYYRTLERFALNSNSDLTHYANAFAHKEFYVIIENEDNPPLQIKGIKAFQLNHYLITHLESENKYKLVFGNKNVFSSPSYDITHFKSKVDSNVPFVKTKAITRLKYVQVEKKEELGNQYWIWVAVAMVAILLAFVSYKMIIEMEKK